MLLRKFYINLVIRIVLILFNMIAIALVIPDLIEKQLMFTLIVFAMILILQIILLLYYIKKTNRLFTKFVLAISNLDFTSKFKTDFSATPYKDLNLAFNKIIKQYQNVTLETQAQHSITDHIIQTIPAGILVFSENDSISFKNRRAENLLGIKEIYSIHQLEDLLPDFYKVMTENEKAGSFIYETSDQNERKKLSVTVKSFKLYSQNQKLISIQDISREIDQGEFDAIQRLMRILTHEIMNSLTPINSLTETITMLMSDEKGDAKPFNTFNEINYNDVRESVIAIKERGEGLDHFVNNFRTLTKLPEKLQTNEVLVNDLLNSVCKIMNTDLNNISVKVEIEKDDLFINVDNALIEQVLINLITNSLTAMSKTKKPELHLKSFIKDNNTFIQVIDNGIGIPNEKLSDIFIPFYSTKEKSSGIGLSFARQIMRLHNGSINVLSNSGEETIFTLVF
jgi:nitrogen fixation/metabolism regulation signal transduction histidine kinase